MRHAIGLVLVCASLGGPPAQAAEEKAWPLCEETAPGSSDLCVEDTLEIVFPGLSDPARDSILEYETFEAGREIEVWVVTDTRSDGVQGWVYGVEHDERYLAIQSVTTEGTAVDECRGFDATRFEDATTCGVVPECPFDGRTPGGGFISSYAFLCSIAYWLPPGRNVIARATYRLVEDPGPDGAFLRFSDRLAYERSPRAPFSVIVDGQNRFWSTAVDGWIKPASKEAGRFIRGDANGDGSVDVSDPVRTLMVVAYGAPPSPCWKAADSDDDGSVGISDAIRSLQWLLLGGQRPPEPFPACGVDSTPDDLPCSIETASPCR